MLLLLLPAACTPPDATGGPITDLAFEENPDNSLSVWATWTTPIPTTSAVRFGPSSEPTWQVSDDAFTTDHRVLVYGLHELQAYEGIAVSTSIDGAVFESDAASFSAGALPYSWLRGDVVTLDADRVQPGWTLCNLATGLITPTVLVIVDADGEPVWYHVEPWDSGFPDIQASRVDDGIAFGPGVPAGESPGVIALSGARAWDGPTQPDGSYTGRMHHVFTPLSDGSFLTVHTERTDDSHSADIAAIVDRDLSVTWEWDLDEHLDRADYGERSEWTSVNSAGADLDAGVAYIYARFPDLLLAVDMASDAILWRFGPGVGNDFSADPDAEYPMFQGAHAVERLPDGNILLYDNGDAMDDAYTDRGWSRAVEYRIDEETFASEIVWEYPPAGSTERWVAHSWGDADRLDNGNTLIDLGDIDPYASPPDTPPTRVIEVTAAGEIVWDLRWDDASGIEGAFQVERIPVLLEEL